MLQGAAALSRCRMAAATAPATVAMVKAKETMRAKAVKATATEAEGVALRVTTMEAKETTRAEAVKATAAETEGVAMAAAGRAREERVAAVASTQACTNRGHLRSHIC